MAVGHYGSIRRAAEELHVSASAVDRQILQAEAELGIPLFERLPSGLRLTAAGEIMMSAGGSWQKGLAAVRGQIEDLRGLRRGHVDIAIINALATGYIPKIVHRVQRDYPGITIALKVLDNLRVRDAIATGDVDFGIYLEPQTYRDLNVRAHAEAVLGIVSLPDHPLARQDKCRFSACASRKLVVPAEPLALCQQVNVLEGATGVKMDIAASSDNIQTIKSLVAEGIGLGILTSLDVITEVRRGELAFIALTDPILKPMTLALCTAASRSLSSAANLVLNEVDNDFAQLGYGAAH